MMLTGAATAERALDAINGGEVVRFFTKPFDVELFRASMEALIERIDRSRREHADATIRARRAELQRWLDRRYPGLLEIEKSAEGDLVVDAGPLAVAVDETKLATARRCFGEDDYIASPSRSSRRTAWGPHPGRRGAMTATGAADNLQAVWQNWPHRFAADSRRVLCLSP